MKEQKSFCALLGRALGGAFAGAVFGLLAEALLYQKGTFPVTGPAIGAGFGLFLAAVAGGLEVPKVCSIAAILGAVVGAFAGLFIYAPLRTALEIEADSPFWGKLQASYESVGLAFGVPIGAMVGLLIGFGIWLRQRRAVGPGLTSSSS